MAHRLLCWLSPDGHLLYSDLEEEYAARRRHSGRLRSRLWLAREFVLACWYGQRDAWLEGQWRFRVNAGPAVQALRSLRRRAGYTVTVIVLIGVASGTLGGLSGIARVIASPGGTDIESVRVIVGTDSERGWTRAYLSMAEIDDLERAAVGLSDVAAFLPGATVGLGRGQATTPVSVVMVEAGYFEILGAQAHLGRTFTESEAMGFGGRVAILSWGLWRDRLISDPGVIGHTIEIAGRPYTVVGVMEETFRDAARTTVTDVWLPMGEAPAYFGERALSSRTFRWMLAVTRVMAGDEARVVAEVDRVAAGLRRDFPAAHRGRGFAFRDLDGWWFGEVERAVRLMMVGGIGLLLLVLGNVAVLFRLRGADRAPEMALRAALGADWRARLAVTLTEATILTLASGSLGVFVAIALLKLGGVRMLLVLPHFAVPQVDVAMVAACVASIVPLAVAFDRPGVKVRPGVRRRPARWLLAVEAALATVMLTAAGALVDDAREVARTDTGYEAAGLLTARLDMTIAETGPAAVAEAARARTDFAEEFVSSAAAIAGVESAALVGPDLLGNAQTHLSFVPEGLDPQANATRWLAQRIVITPGALSTLGVSLLEGRDVGPADRNAEAPAAVVDERIAQRFWPDGDALGKRFCATPACVVPHTIVGVAESAKHRGRTAPDAGIAGDVYLSYHTSPTPTATVAIRTRGMSRDVSRAVQSLIGALAPSAVLSDVQWMEDRLRADEYVMRVTASLVAAYALVAALLALIGTHGLVSFHLGRRWRDVALRMALGARVVLLARAVMAEAIVPVAIGAVAGALSGLIWIPDLTSSISRVGGLGGWGWTESAIALAVLLAAGAAAALMAMIRLTRLRPMAVLNTH